MGKENQEEDLDKSVIWEEKIRYLCPIAQPLASRKLNKKINKVIKKGLVLFLSFTNHVSLRILRKCRKLIMFITFKNDLNVNNYS